MIEACLKQPPCSLSAWNSDRVAQSVHFSQVQNGLSRWSPFRAGPVYRRLSVGRTGWSPISRRRVMTSDSSWRSHATLITSSSRRSARTARSVDIGFICEAGRKKCAVYEQGFCGPEYSRLLLRLGFLLPIGTPLSFDVPPAQSDRIGIAGADDEARIVELGSRKGTGAE